jgi:hypothetical protein
MVRAVLLARGTTRSIREVLSNESRCVLWVSGGLLR